MLVAPTSYNFLGVVVTQSFLMWVFIGLVAGWLAGKIGRGRGFGCLVDIILGMVGAVLGGWIFSKLGIQGSGLLFSIAAATVGAVVLVLIARVFSHSGRED